MNNAYKRLMWFFYFLFYIFIINLPAEAGKPVKMFSAPAGTRQAVIDTKKGEFILPNGRMLTPWGRNVVLPPHPYGLAVSLDGKTAVTLQTTNKPYFISVVGPLDGKPKVKTITPDKIDIRGAFMGLAVSPDGGTLYVSAGNEGAIVVVNLPEMTLRAKISLNG